MDSPKWKVVDDQSKSRAGEHRVQRSARHSSLRDDLPGNDGIVSSKPLLYPPNDDPNAEDDEDENYAPVAPGVLLATPGQGQQQADDRWHEDGDSERIELRNDLGPALVFEAVGVFLVVAWEAEQD